MGADRRRGGNKVCPGGEEHPPIQEPPPRPGTNTGADSGTYSDTDSVHRHRQSLPGWGRLVVNSEYRHYLIN